MLAASLANGFRYLLLVNADMAFIPDEAILSCADLTPAAFKLYALYCMRRNRNSGSYTFRCKSYYDEIGLSRTRFIEARNELVSLGWIAVEDLTVTPLKGFHPVEKPTSNVENSTPVVENSTESVEISSKPVENSTSLNNPYKEYQPVTSHEPISCNPAVAGLPFGEPEESVSVVVSEKPTEFSDLALEVFSYWQQVMGHTKARFSDDRRRKIKARLRDGFTGEELKRAVDGCKNSPHHMGQNETKEVYDSIDLIFRNAEKTEMFIAKAPRKAPAPPPAPALELTPEQEEKNRRAAFEAFNAHRERMGQAPMTWEHYVKNFQR